MQITLHNDIPRPAGRTKPKKTPSGVTNAIGRYAEAYKVLFGISPEVTYKSGYIRIWGQAQGVKLCRLREMTKQLRWRAG